MAATFKIGDQLDPSRLGNRLVNPSELFALKWGGQWWPSYRSGWDNGKGQVNVTTINESNEAEVYITGDGLKNMPSFRDVMKSDGPNGPLRITPRLMTAAERAFVNTRSELSQQTWVSASPSSMVDIVAPYYAEITCDMPPKPNGSRVALWRAFWQLLTDQAWQNGPEFDIMEEFGERDGKARITTGLHTSTGSAWASTDDKGNIIGGALKKAIDAGLIKLPIEYTTTGTSSQNLNLDGKQIYRFGGWVDTTGFYIFVGVRGSGPMTCVWTWPYATDFTGRKSYMSADFAIGKGGTGAGDIQSNETTVGTWTIYDIGVWDLNAGAGGGTGTTPTPTPTPPSTSTNIKAGDLWNFSGASRLVDMTSLDPANLKSGDNSDAGIDLRSGRKITQWMGGLASGQWANISSIPGYAAFSNLFNNGDAQVYANGDLLRSGKVRNTAVLANGKVTITPVPLTAAEAALATAGPKASHLSSAFNTFPFGLKPPFAFGAKCTMPDDMAFGSGDWPAIWALPVSKGWPPEIDAMDGYNSDPNQGPLSFNGGIVPSNGWWPNKPDGSVVSKGGSQAPVTPGSHTWMAVVYPDVCALFLDGKCTHGAIQPSQAVARTSTLGVRYVL